MANPLLHCPIRGSLKVPAKAKDGLTFTEEKRRIDCIKLLLSKGYPKDRFVTETVVLKIGYKGQNSLRADIVVYDCPALGLQSSSLAQRLDRVVLIAEIKRESTESENAKTYQLIPALRFIPSMGVLGVYWDDVEQSVLFKQLRSGTVYIKDVAIAHVPHFGVGLQIKEIRFSDLEPPTDLVKLFSKIDDVLHQKGHDLEERYLILLQFLLIRIYDEQKHKSDPSPMIIQDFDASETDGSVVHSQLNDALAKSLVLYQKYLPKRISSNILVEPDALKAISKLMCRVNLLDASPYVMQEFYMYFARSMYKVDLAQYFTPYEIVEFIVKLANPKFGDSVKDPACGSADFLVAAFRFAKQRHGTNLSDQVYGADTGASAVQISVLNMLLNGDGKSNIVKEDSLATVKKNTNQFTVILCNPPFGKDIVEKRSAVLKEFDLGKDDNGATQQQETGILFAELCVRTCQPGQRIAIIVPNGYLGNRSDRYVRLRQWILRHTRVAAVIAFPRFTFKKSGADVSASILLLEKRTSILESALDTELYPIHFNILEKVGWDVRNKRAEKVFLRRNDDGSIILNEDNDPVLDADFDRVLNDIYASPVADAFPWISSGVPGAGAANGWAVSIADILAESDFIIDAKRWCEKYRSLVAQIEKSDHFKIGNVFDFASSSLESTPEFVYRYVEIASIFENLGAYDWEELRGWQLPGRAKHIAKPGDFFVAHIWSSVGKWFVAGGDAADGRLIVTSGCYHLRLREGMEEHIPDIIYGFSSELFRVQMRALATGSDGLSVVGGDDLLNIVLPKISSPDTREELRLRVVDWMSKGMSLRRLVENSIKMELPAIDVPPRPSHVAQV